MIAGLERMGRGALSNALASIEMDLRALDHEIEVDAATPASDRNVLEIRKIHATRQRLRAVHETLANIKKINETLIAEMQAQA